MNDNAEKKNLQPNIDDNTESTTVTPSENTSGWFSWYNDAKAKTMSTFDMVKRDLSEFGETAMSTVDSIVGQKPQDLGAKAGRWIKQIANTVNDTVLQMTDTTQDEQTDEVPILVYGSDKLANLQADSNTFLTEPPGVPELFEDWLDHFDLAEKKAEIQDILNTNTVMRRQFAELVPSKVQNHVFWKRYFYKVHQLELEQAKIDNFLQKTETKEIADKKSSSDLDSWGDDSDFDDLTVIAEKCLGPNAKPVGQVPEDLDEKTTTAVLEMEDRLNEQKQHSRRTKNYSRPNDVTISKGGGLLEKSINNRSTTTHRATDEDDEKSIDNSSSLATPPDESMTSSAVEPGWASVLGEQKIAPVENNDEEIRSENSFCVVKSIDSSDN